MPKAKQKKTESGRKNKKKYKVINWKEYNEALVNRGKILFEISLEALEKWEEEQKNEKKKKKPGRPKKFSDLAIETALTLRVALRLPLRSTEGVLGSILKHLGSRCVSPDYSTLSLRGKRFPVSIRLRSIRKENLHLVVDSTGIKVFGEGEWKVRKHGWGKHRTWLKLHVGVDEKTGDILMGEVTANTHDLEAVAPMFSQIPKDQKIDQFSGDGAYDRRKCYEILQEKGVSKITIPPQRNAKIWKHGNSKEGKRHPHPRDENLREIRKTSMKRWKKENDYHRRSLSETTMFRLKTLFGDRVFARTFGNQRTELLLRLRILNRLTLLGMPESRLVE